MNTIKYLLCMTFIVASYNTYSMDNSSYSESWSEEEIEMSLDPIQKAIIEEKNKKIYIDYYDLVSEIALSLPEDQLSDFNAAAHSPKKYKALREEENRNKRAYPAAFHVAPNADTEQRSPKKKLHTSPQKPSSIVLKQPEAKSVCKKLF